MTPFNGVLFAVSVVSLFSDVIFAAPEDRSFRTIIVLLTMVLSSTLLRFWQEFRSNKAAQELKAMVTSTAAVLRAGMGRPQEVPIATLVLGDIVYLSAGDMVPADVRLIAAKDLFVSQAMLTGESLPLEICRAADKSEAERYSHEMSRSRKRLLHGHERGERHGCGCCRCDR